jgi:hypothetical protein
MLVGPLLCVCRARVNPYAVCVTLHEHDKIAMTSLCWLSLRPNLMKSMFNINTILIFKIFIDIDVFVSVCI